MSSFSVFFFFFKQKTAYEMRISDWSSDVCSSDLRDPREIHKPLLDTKMYERTYSPDPTWCRILEYYCPQCGTLVEAEYLPPGHPPVHDIELDIDALKLQWKDRKEVTEPTVGPDLALEKIKNNRALHAEHQHGHKH